MRTDTTAEPCLVCGAIKLDKAVLRDHVLNVHPDDHCRLYHQQPCQIDRRERYMEALREADTYALIQRRDDRSHFAGAVMKVADAEIPAVLRAVADMIDLRFATGTATNAAMEIRRIAGELTSPGTDQGGAP